VISHSKVHSVCTLYRPGEWLWVDSSGTNRKPTFRRRANLLWLYVIFMYFADIASSCHHIFVYSVVVTRN